MASTQQVWTDCLSCEFLKVSVSSGFMSVQSKSAVSLCPRAADGIERSRILSLLLSILLFGHSVGKKGYIFCRTYCKIKMWDASFKKEEFQCGSRTVDKEGAPLEPGACVTRLVEGCEATSEGRACAR